MGGDNGRASTVKPQDQSLPKPTVELVREVGERFDRENEDTESALTWLVKHCPQNTSGSEILLKVAAINQLYSTQIYAVRIVADHIAKLNIDADLDARSLQLVDKVASVKIGDKSRYNLSFASKYCSWHRPESYPIYDARVEACLWAYRLQFGLRFARKDLWNYISFVDAVNEFQCRFELHPSAFKQIDKFLYLTGTDLIEAQEKARAAGKEPTTLCETVLEVGAEGGSITLIRERKADEDWQFQMTTNETALYDQLSEEDRNEIGEHFAQTGYVRSFHEALTLLDRYPWFGLYPLKVHPEFLDRVLLEVRKRGGPPEETRWRATLK
jgi:hypothetical protein